jgi:hypothetical protein
MEIDLIRPTFLLKLFLSVAWLVFLFLSSTLSLPLIWNVFIAVGTVGLVVGWFIYPYPFELMGDQTNNDTNEE